MTFGRFAVVGEAPSRANEKLLEQLTVHALRPGEFGVEEVEYGWGGGRHIFDGEFSFENNVFADCLSFALRIDTNKVPGAVKKAYTLMEESVVAKGNPSGFISKQQKKDVRDTVRQKVDADMKAGKYRRSKLIPVLWDLANGMVYAAAGGRNFEKLAEIFERSFKCELEPLTAGSHAARILSEKGKRREYEDFKPTRFVYGPDGEGQPAEYPWTAKGAQPKDFLGNEFLLWLWHHADARDGEISTQGVGEVALVLDRMLDLDCVFGQTGRDSLRGSGPTRMPEARDALRSGKVPRKAAMTMHAQGNQYDFTLNPEQMVLTGAKLPEVEDADSPRVLFEERIALLRDLSGALNALYETFLGVRAGGAWDSAAGGIRKWILQNAPKPAMAVA
jgi:hypothetical protein